MKWLSSALCCLWHNLRNLRNAFLLLGVLAAALTSYATDPDGGLSTMLAGVTLLQGLVAVAIVHLLRKILSPYREADWRALFAAAGKDATGAGLALLSQAIVLYALITVFAPRAHAAPIADARQGQQTLPAGYLRYGPLLWQAQRDYWPDHPRPAVLAALAEQESCPRLTSPQCWNPAARLQSAREEGAGIGQLTRAYYPDGRVRFDMLHDMRQQYPQALGSLSWDTIYQRPELQLRALVLLSREQAQAFRQLPALARLPFADAAYNGGIADVRRERRACHLTPGCDPAQWFGHVALHCQKSRQPLYGRRSACDINRQHVEQVLKVKPHKYESQPALMH